MQRMKGQGGPVTNGPKDPVNDEEFDSWRNQPHQAFQSYSTPVSASSMGDPYMSSYYGMSFPYQNLGLGEGAWSNGSETMTFLGGYGGQMAGDQHSHYVDSMLGAGGGGGGGFGGFGQPGFNYFHGGNNGGGDYSAWGTTSGVAAGAGGGGRKPVGHGHYEDYYGDMYVGGAERGGAADQRLGGNVGVNVGGMKPLDQGMQGLSIVEKVDPGKMDAMGKGGGAAAGGGGGGGGNGGPVDFVVKDGGGPGGLVLAGGGGGQQGGSQAPKKMTWASIASQPAKPQPKIKPKSIPPAPMLPGKHNMDIGTWESKNGNGGMKPNNVGGGGGQGGQGGGQGGGGGMQPAPRPGWGAPRGRGAGGFNNGAQVAPSGHPGGPQGGGGGGGNNGGGGGGLAPGVGYPAHPVLDKLRQSNEYNPKELEVGTKNARFFIIKSYSEDDIHRSIKYGIWCSTEHGNKRLDSAYRDQEAKSAALLLLFSVNGSGHFCGVAQMTSHLDYNSTANVWAQDKWKGEFKVRWIYVKDVPNSQLRHIRLENNENKPVTNSRDTQEVPADKGRLVLKIIHNYRHTTSIFDDFVHYEKRQEEEDQRKQVHPASIVASPGSGGGGGGAVESGARHEEGNQ